MHNINSLIKTKDSSSKALCLTDTNLCAAGHKTMVNFFRLGKNQDMIFFFFYFYGEQEVNHKLWDFLGL